jgi:splicing factor 3B subunit 1
VLRPIPCPQDALADRDLVHRQTAATVVQHLALGVAGLSCEDALTHLLNFVWPNVFEDSPHLINGVMGAVDGCRLALGPCVVLHYTLQVCGAGRWAGSGAGCFEKQKKGAGLGS